MTQQFHEGQDVEVYVSIGDAYDAPMSTAREWRKAKIVRSWPYPTIGKGQFLGIVAVWQVQFPEPDGKYDVDGSRAVFDVEHIREVSP